MRFILVALPVSRRYSERRDAENARKNSARRRLSCAIVVALTSVGSSSGVVDVSSELWMRRIASAATMINGRREAAASVVVSAGWDAVSAAESELRISTICIPSPVSAAAWSMHVPRSSVDARRLS